MRDSIVIEPAGASPEAVARDLDQAIQFHIEGLIEDGLPVPPPKHPRQGPTLKELLHEPTPRGDLASPERRKRRLRPCR